MSVVLNMPRYLAGSCFYLYPLVCSPVVIYVPCSVQSFPDRMKAVFSMWKCVRSPQRCFPKRNTRYMEEEEHAMSEMLLHRSPYLHIPPLAEILVARDTIVCIGNTSCIVLEEWPRAHVSLRIREPWVKFFRCRMIFTSRRHPVVAQQVKYAFIRLELG